MDPRSLRLTDAEREAAVARLSEHYAVGRLDKDEFDERSDAVWSARTRGQIDPVFADLELATPLLGRPSPRGARRRLPLRRIFAPALFVLIALSILIHLPLWILGLIAWFTLVGPKRCASWGSGHHSRGSWRRESGSWA